MIRMRFARGLLVVLLLSSLVACGRGREASDAGSGEAEVEGSTALAEGEHFVFVRGADGLRLVVDPAVFLTGDTATAAAREDGLIGASETVPNDFYIRNPRRDEVLIAVASDAEVRLLAHRDGVVEIAVPLDELWSLLAGELSP